MEKKNILNEANVKINQKKGTTENRNKHPYNSPNFRLSVASANKNMQMVRSHLHFLWAQSLDLAMVMWTNYKTESNICADTFGIHI